MRRSGVVVNPADLGAHSHACFAFHEPAELHVAVAAYAPFRLAVAA